ncbi:MAG: heavy metal translocating P-type ATPase [Gemmatimonadetes bacterium]|nr:heavy metal translocating P-type ATPase [Gemmatimonadota bacterium]
MAMATDPVCGMQVDTETAPERIAHGDHTHYFCSAECKAKFQADPARYGDAHAAGGHGAGGGMERHEPPYTTSGGITAPKFGSAGSGGLEYEPLPEAHDDPGHKH